MISCNTPRDDRADSHAYRLQEAQQNHGVQRCGKHQ